MTTTLAEYFNGVSRRLPEEAERVIDPLRRKAP